MTFKTEQIVTVTEANQNFSRVTRVAEKHGCAVIFKNSRPQYAVYDLTSERAPLELTDEERIDVMAARILTRYRAAFKELAK